MKIAILLSTLLAGASSFVVVPGPSTNHHHVDLRALVPESEMTADQLEIKRITEKWSKVRHLSREEAAKLEPEWKEAYDRYFEKYDADLDYMIELTKKIKGYVQPAKIAKKSKGQKKRDKWAIVQAREAARAAAAK